MLLYKLSIMLKNRYWNSNSGPSEGAKIQHFQRMVSLDPMGDSTKFAGHSPSENLLKDEQNFKRRDVEKGGPNIKGRPAMELGPPCFWNVYFIIFWLYYLIRENTDGDASQQNLSFHWVFLKIVSIKFKTIEKKSKMWAQLLEF